MFRFTRLLVLALALQMSALLPGGAARGESRRDQGLPPMASRLPEDEVIYFLLPDRFDNADPNNDTGGMTGGPMETGFDPTNAGFFNGGDIKGVIRRLDYIQALGATAIWLGPIYRNKPVQGTSAGYHGYWITDFTDVDPHFGTRADLKELVDRAHARGMKIYLDIVVNHTADVIQYRECQTECPYRSVAEFPYTRRGGTGGPAINGTFSGASPGPRSNADFAELTRPDFAYTPFIPEGAEHAKKPEWLNDPIYYHNRGDTTYRGESGELGDFGGLDDLFTEHPRVREGMIEIFGQWIDDFAIDGFRIDTAKHVDAEFWHAFIPAMAERAARRGVTHFHIFGEAFYEKVALQAAFSRRAHMQSVLDFAFQVTAKEVIANSGPAELFADLFAADILYPGGPDSARKLPTFTGNHDGGRFAWHIRRARPDASDNEIIRRVILGYAVSFFGRGQPVIYYGDEQGFSGTGDDRLARQSLFAARVPEYAAEHTLGTDQGLDRDHFGTDHPIFKALAKMAAVRGEDRALRRGKMTVRAADAKPGLFAFSRVLPDRETIVAINTGSDEIDTMVQVENRSVEFQSSGFGSCAPKAAAPGSYRMRVPPLGFVVCRSESVKKK